ncbi:MAG: MurT ligase domain-containing protein, partial [Oscillospiraceae bacterium]
NANMNTLTVGGSRLYDLALRFKYSGIDVDHVTKNIKSALQSCMSTDSEVCYVLVNYTVLFSTQTTMLELQKNANNKLEVRDND